MCASTVDEEFPTDACSSCGARIIWARVAKTGKSMPVDAAPVPDGTVSLAVAWDGRILAEVLPVAKRFGRDRLYQSHFVTCPHAARHRRPRTGAP